MYNKIILVVDEVKKKNASIFRNDIEGNSVEQNDALVKSFREFTNVKKITDLKAFLKEAKKIKDDVIFPMYYGTASYNSKALVPSICEANNLSYIGGDTFCHIICNNKTLSKSYSHDFEIATPKSILIYAFSDAFMAAKDIRSLTLPLIVKPNCGGGSVGISEKNFCNTYESALKLAYFLLETLNVPIMIEEYVSGYESELIIVGNNRQIYFSEEVSLKINNKSFLESEVWGFEGKAIDDSSISCQTSNYISALDRKKLLALFQSFEKADIMRIDGRVNQHGTFYLTELSPDCYLGEDCAFYHAFQKHGYSHSEMLQFIVETSLQSN